VLDFLSSVEWKVNKKVLETIEYIYTIGGGIAAVPKRFNERIITPELIKAASFVEKLKLLKEHQQNNEMHSLRCDFLIKLNMA
jgi:DNA-directed RNA polymerase